MYEVVMSREAAKKYDKMDNHLQERFDKKISKLETAPDKYGKPLRSDLSGYWELYFEKSFRIIYTIDKAGNTVKIRAIKHKNEF